MACAEEPKLGSNVLMLCEGGVRGDSEEEEGASRVPCALEDAMLLLLPPLELLVPGEDSCSFWLARRSAAEMAAQWMAALGKKYFSARTD